MFIDRIKTFLEPRDDLMDLLLSRARSDVGLLKKAFIDAGKEGGEELEFAKIVECIDRRMEERLKSMPS